MRVMAASAWRLLLRSSFSLAFFCSSSLSSCRVSAC
jgi:hypothetical protein